MTNRKKLDPTESAKSLYGHRLRKHRDRHGWSQPQLADQVFCTGDLISKIETGVNIATLAMSVRFDTLFGLDEEFAELQPLAAKEIIPWWFRPYTEFEKQATAVRIFDPLHIPGLLQTEPYARVILSSRHDGEALDQAVAARIGRQSILTGERRVWLIVLVSEWALRRPVGDQKIKQEQLQHLLDVSQRRNITIHIVRDTAPDFATAAFTLFSFAEEPDMGWVESVKGFGRPIDKHSEVEDLKVEFDLVRASALNADDSAELIRAMLESC